MFLPLFLPLVWIHEKAKIQSRSSADQIPDQNKKHLVVVLTRELFSGSLRSSFSTCWILFSNYSKQTVASIIMTARPEPPLESNTLKQILRAGLDTQISRGYWWPLLPTLKLEENVVIDKDQVPELVGSAERLPEIINEPLLDHRSVIVNPKEKESEVIDQTARKLSSVLISQNKVAQIDISYWIPLVKIISWQVKRIDVCYWMLDSVIQQPDR
jgi:hypothetical protein